MAASWQLAHSRCLVSAAKSRIENLCAQAQWLQCILYHWNWSIPKLLLHGSWAETQALGLSDTVGCPESLKLVPAHLVWHLLSCWCGFALSSLQSCVFAYPTPLKGPGHSLANSSLLHFMVVLFSLEVIYFTSPFFLSAPHVISLTSSGSMCCSKVLRSTWH